MCVCDSDADSLEKDNERPRMINCQYKTKCKCLRVSLAAYKEGLNCTGGQGELRTRTQLQEELDSQED